MTAEEAVQRVGDRLRVRCATCGEFQVSGTDVAIAAAKLAGDSVATAKVSFGLRRMQEHAPWPMLDPGVMERIIEENLPSPREQADNLILWLGRHLRDSGPQSKLELDPDECAAIMGAVGFQGSMYVLTQLGDNVW